MASDDDVLQLAMYTAARDAKRWGAEFQPGVFRPTWDERGLLGQEAYIEDARIQFEAVEMIQRIRSPR
jgi:hypothetical protein